MPDLSPLFRIVPSIDLKDKLASFAQTLTKRFRMFFCRKVNPLLFLWMQSLSQKPEQIARYD